MHFAAGMNQASTSRALIDKYKSYVFIGNPIMCSVKSEAAFSALTGAAVSVF